MVCSDRALLAALAPILVGLLTVPAVAVFQAMRGPSCPASEAVMPSTNVPCATAVIVISGPLLRRRCTRSATACRSLTRRWPDMGSSKLETEANNGQVGR